MTYNYLTESDRDQMKAAQTYEELLAVALDILKRLPQPVGFVCGPVTSGGAGSIEANLKRIEDAIIKLEENGVTIFAQTPFEEEIERLRAVYEESRDEYPELLDQFFVPIFSSGLIQTFYFLPDWESSKGATWEHEQAPKWGVKIVYLD